MSALALRGLRCMKRAVNKTRLQFELSLVVLALSVLVLLIHPEFIADIKLVIGIVLAYWFGRGEHENASSGSDSENRR